MSPAKSKPTRYILQMKLVQVFPNNGTTYRDPRESIWCSKTIQPKDLSTEALGMFNRFMEKVKGSIQT